MLSRLCLTSLQALQKLREGSILDEELLNSMFHNLRLGELRVHHKILLESLIKQSTDRMEDKPEVEGRPKSKWDVNTSTIGAVMYSTVSLVVKACHVLSGLSVPCSVISRALEFGDFNLMKVGNFCQWSLERGVRCQSYLLS